MSKTTLITRTFRCLACCEDKPMEHFRAQFWTRKQLREGGPLFEPAFWDLRCPSCGAGPQFFTSWPVTYNAFVTLRSEYRPVVYRWFDKKGHERFRYPARNDTEQRPTEERIEFPSLRSMESFLKEQNPTYRDWQVPLNDILDYDNPDTAIDETDPGVAQEAAEVLDGDESLGGVTSEAEIAEFMARTDGAALIEKA